MSFFSFIHRFNVQNIKAASLGAMEIFPTLTIQSYPNTGLSMELDRSCLKEAIVMWTDMHSFLELDKFEPISNS